jgi:hypothetical protein
VNVLSFTTSDLNGLTIDFLVDGKPLAELVGTDTIGVPYYYLENGLRPLTVRGEEYRIITCCNCGEAGCGSVVCKVVEDGEFVVFDDFQFSECSPTFRFSAANFKQVMAEIRALTAVAEEQQKILDEDEAKQAEEDAKFNCLVVAAYVDAVAKVLAKPGLAEQIAREIRIEKFTAHEVAKWLTSTSAQELVKGQVLQDLRLFKGSVDSTPPIETSMPHSWGLYVYADDKAINLICAGYGKNRMEIIESFSLPAPISLSQA